MARRALDAAGDPGPLIQVQDVPWNAKTAKAAEV